MAHSDYIYTLGFFPCNHPGSYGCSSTPNTSHIPHTQVPEKLPKFAIESEAFRVITQCSFCSHSQEMWWQCYHTWMAQTVGELFLVCISHQSGKLITGVAFRQPSTPVKAMRELSDSVIDYQASCTCTPCWINKWFSYFLPLEGNPVVRGQWVIFQEFFAKIGGGIDTISCINVHQFDHYNSKKDLRHLLWYLYLFFRWCSYNLSTGGCHDQCLDVSAVNSLFRGVFLRTHVHVLYTSRTYETTWVR